MSRHRKNAAEWMMYVVLVPFVPIVWLIERVQKNRKKI